MNTRRDFLKFIGFGAASLALQQRLFALGVDAANAIENWPKLQKLLYGQAGKGPVTIRPGSSVTVTAANAAIAPDIKNIEVLAADAKAVGIGADGFLTLAVDVSEDMYLAGSVSVKPDGDLRPGVRFLVLSDSAVIAAPMVKAEPWQSVGGKFSSTGSLPDIKGSIPPVETPLVKWRLSKGRHYITIAGPHFRPGGVFEKLTITALKDKPEKPLYKFALLADTHIGDGRQDWMNYIVRGPEGAAEFAGTLKQLKAEGISFALLAGDMTHTSTRQEFETAARVINEAKLPCYGCVGNHDAYLATARGDMLELLPGLFPGGATDYALNKPPIRFIVLDGSYWKNKAGEVRDFIDWNDFGGMTMLPEEIERFGKRLAEDTKTPTIVISHYPFANRGDISSSGYKTNKYSARKEILELIEKAPNVIATFNGHTHYNAVSDYNGVTCVQNPAIAEWPNAFRLFSVYPDRIEWQLRQVANRGFIRESFNTKKSLSWMISTGPDDLAGQVGFASKAKQ